ncbi:MAG: hypothetical protein AB1610_05125 [Nitrospirota bacterium]
MDEKETKTYNYVYDNEDIILEYLTKTENGESKTEITRYIHANGIDEPLAIERKEDVICPHFLERYKYGDLKLLNL